MTRLSAIRVYDEGTAPALDLPALVGYLASRTGCPAVQALGPFLEAHTPSERRPELAERMARLKVRDVDRPLAASEPAYAEIAFERRRLSRGDRGPFGILYDGFGYQRLLRELLPRDKVALDHVHIVLTNRTLGTWGEDDLRYHLRTIILGVPAVISTTGLVEAPAKPREFYLARQRLGAAANQELSHALLKEQFRGQFLDHDDPHLTEVLKGYAMQAVVYQITGEAFCSDPDCRLFNAHWQAELMRAQLQGPVEYCGRHEELLGELRRQQAG